MKSIVEIFKADIKMIFKNYAAFIVVLALCILPSLYAWFNIKASWDPYSKEATRNVKVGVVNEDVGVTLKGKNIELGQMVVDELKKNDQLGWQFVSREEAMDALKQEKYYATITIPSDFSKNLTSIVSEDIQKGTIIYTVNEKINAIAPKLTDKGVTSLQNMISKTVVETVSSTLLEMGKDIGINLEKEIPNITKAYQMLIEIQGKFPEVEQTVTDTKAGVKKLKTFLNDVEGNVPKISDLLSKSVDLGNELTDFLVVAKNSSDQLEPVLINNLETLSSFSDNITNKLNLLRNREGLKPEEMSKEITETTKQVNNLQTFVNGFTKLLKRLNGFSSQESLAEQITLFEKAGKNLGQLSTALDGIIKKLENGELDVSKLVEDAFAKQSKISEAINKISTGLKTTLAPALEKIFNDSNTVATDAVQILKDAKEKLPEVTKLTTAAVTTTDKGEKAISYADNALPKAKSLVNDLVDKLKKVNEEDELVALIDLLKVDVEKRTDFLGTPINIQEEKIYEMGNYGTGMTPFYTVLCLWVGILLLTSMLTVEVHGEYKPYQAYFGKLLLFVSITLVQALIVSLGDLYLLNIYCVNPAIFIGANLLTSIFFTIIVYSFVSVLGNAGKVLGIIMLVLQVAGSGGTFPIQMTPRFFQLINPYLPFTYCISLNREAIGGIVMEVVRKDLLVIGCYALIVLVLAVLLKGPINKWLEKFVIRFKESKLGES